MGLALLAGACGDSEQSGLAVTEAVDSVDPDDPDAGSETDDPVSGDADSEADSTPDDGDGDDGPIRSPQEVGRTTVLPESFWAITDEDHRLVRVETATGEIVAELGGWGQALDTDGGEPVQVLTTVESAPGGSAWLDDCCEPAIGSSYRVAEGQVFDPINRSEDLVRVDGYGPQVSRNGELVAVTVGGRGTGVLRASDLSSVITVDAMSTLLAEATGADPEFVDSLALAWLSDDVVVIQVFLADHDAIRFVDVSGPEPAVVGAELDVDAAVIAADVRNDGHLVVATVERDDDSPEAPVAGRVIDPDSGEQIAVFNLPDGTFDMDYDPTATYLITVADDGAARWIGRGETGAVGQGFVAASW